MNDNAVALYYAVGTVIIVALYREPLAALGRELRGWYAVQRAGRTVSISSMRGRLWDDVRAAVENA